MSSRTEKVLNKLDSSEPASQKIAGSITDTALTSSSMVSADEESAPVFKKPRDSDSSAENASLDRLQLTRAARDTLRLAIDFRSTDLEAAELQFTECRRHLDRLWSLANYQQDEFCDLLAAVELALKDENLLEFNSDLFLPIETALSLLIRPFQDAAEVTELIDRIAANGFNLLAPFTSDEEQVFNISISKEPA